MGATVPHAVAAVGESGVMRRWQVDAWQVDACRMNAWQVDACRMNACQVDR
jgi:hypothetical protein